MSSLNIEEKSATYWLNKLRLYHKIKFEKKCFTAFVSKSTQALHCGGARDMWFKMIWWVEAQIVHQVVCIGQIFY